MALSESVRFIGRPVAPAVETTTILESNVPLAEQAVAPSFAIVELQKPSVLDTIRTAIRASDRSPSGIRKTKEIARKRGRLPGLIVEIALFNAEDFDRRPSITATTVFLADYTSE